jgi:hypothetical protein
LIEYSIEFLDRIIDGIFFSNIFLFPFISTHIISEPAMHGGEQQRTPIRGFEDHFGARKYQSTGTG